MTSHLPYLVGVGFVPVAAMLLLVIVTRLEAPAIKPRSELQEEDLDSDDLHSARLDRS